MALEGQALTKIYLKGHLKKYIYLKLHYWFKSYNDLKGWVEIKEEKNLEIFFPFFSYIYSRIEE